jgi:hypothetical protein
LFGEALAFYELSKSKQLLVVYNPLYKCQQVLKKWRGMWENTIKVLEVAAIHSIVGIWPAHEWVYVLRKHPGLNILNKEESGISGQEDEEEEEEEEEN